MADLNTTALGMLRSLGDPNAALQSGGVSGGLSGALASMLGAVAGGSSNPLRQTGQPTLVDQMMRLQDPAAAQFNPGAFLRGYRNSQTDTRNWAAMDQNLLNSKQDYNFNEQMNPIRVNTAQHQLDFALQQDPLQLKLLRQQVRSADLTNDVNQYGFDRKQGFDAVSDAAKTYVPGVTAPDQLEKSVRAMYGDNVSIDPATGDLITKGGDGKEYRMQFAAPYEGATFYGGLGTPGNETAFNALQAKKTAETYLNQGDTAAARKAQNEADQLMALNEFEQRIRLQQSGGAGAQPMPPPPTGPYGSTMPPPPAGPYGSTAPMTFAPQQMSPSTPAKDRRDNSFAPVTPAGPDPQQQQLDLLGLFLNAATMANGGQQRYAPRNSPYSGMIDGPAQGNNPLLDALLHSPSNGMPTPVAPDIYIKRRY